MATNTYITMDTMKPDLQTFIDLSSQFQGRVGDSQSFIKLWYQSNGLNLNLTDYTVYFQGVDPNGNLMRVVGGEGPNQTGDNKLIGRISFFFPANFFQALGTWDTENTYFGIEDSNGTRISTLNVKLVVLSNSVDMTINAKPYISEFEAKSDELDKWIEDEKKALDSNGLTDSINSLKKQIDAIQFQADAKDYVTNADFSKLQTQVKSTSIIDSRGQKKTPADYFASNPLGIITELFNTADLGITEFPDGVKAGSVIANTQVPGDASQGYPVQEVTLNNAGSVVTYRRVGTSASAWSQFSMVTYW